MSRVESYKAERLKSSDEQVNKNTDTVVSKEKDQEKAAIKIQAVQRGKKDRETVKKIRREKVSLNSQPSLAAQARPDVIDKAIGWKVFV